MKKIKFNNKLSIEQTTIALLDDNQMAGLNGGAKSASKSCPISASCTMFTTTAHLTTK